MGDSEVVACLRAEIVALSARVRDAEAARVRAPRHLRRVSEELTWAEQRVRRLTDRCTRLAERVPVGVAVPLGGAGPRIDGPAGGPGEGLAGVLAAGPVGARLAAAVQVAVGEPAARSCGEPDGDPGPRPGLLGELPDATLIDVAAAGQRVSAWAQLAAALATEELAGRWEHTGADEVAHSVNTSRDLGFRAAVAEAATACVIPEGTLAARVEAIRELPIRFPRLWRQVTSGALDLDRARLIHGKTLHLPTDTLAGLEPRILDKASLLTWGQLSAWLERLVAAADPRGLSAQIADNINGRSLVFRPAGAGIGRMSLTASVADIEAIRTAVAVLAAGVQDEVGDQRTGAAIRADVVTDAITSAATGDRPLVTPANVRPNPGPLSETETQTAPHTETGCEPATGSGWTPAAPTGAANGATAQAPALDRNSPRTGAMVHVTVPLSLVLGGEGIGEVGEYGPLDADAVRGGSGRARTPGRHGDLAVRDHR